MNRRTLQLLFILAGLLLAACSAERNNPLSKTYHNTTARYNGYFLAREKMRLMEDALQEQTQYDYNQVLPIYPTIDTTTAKAFEADLEDIKKKASHPIQYHKNSKWIDNSYIQIGKANFYQLNFAEAVRTFKYVSAISKDTDDRHEALVWLMRSFMQLGETENAQQVSEYLRKERLNKANARELYLARAHYYRQQADTAQVMENLALSLPNFEDKDDESRVRYTLAQFYQLKNQKKEAYEQYSKILRRNPPYDLGFFSRLNLGQVSELSDEQDRERIAGYYQKLLKDEKNLEYRDRIYYEMAQFELRQDKYDKALELLQKSLKTPGSLSNQKGYSYVSAGEIYFDNLQQYDLAAAYYDSAVQVYPQRAPEYEAVVERRDILADFAKQYSTIQTQDSLQRLARMSEPERLEFVQALVQREEEARQQELARQQEQQQLAQAQPSRSNRRSQNGEAFGTTTEPGGVWYFDNPSAMASARSEFVRRWGDRPLQDFWRYRSRGETNEQPAAAIAQAPATVQDTTQAQLSPEELASAQVQTYLQNIPLTTADMQRSEKQVEEALFRLAKIYAQNLNDTAQAEQTYLELLQRFPKSEHTAEVYYSLYLLYGKAGNAAQQQVYYNKVKQEFPNTTYARLLDDSEFLTKNAADNLKARALYDSAFSFYDTQEYERATALLNQVTSQYPLNDIKDKVSFLEVMVTARTQKPEVLRQQLERFRKNYPGSPLQPQANQLLAIYNELEQKNQLRSDAPAAPAPKEPKGTAALTPEQKVSTELASITASTAKATPQLPPAPAAVTPEPKPQQQPAALPQAAAPQPDSAATTAPAQPAAATPADSAGVTTMPATPAADPLAYEAAADSAYYFVLVYPAAAAAFKDISAKYALYNSTYFRNEKLTLDSVAMAEGKTMLLVKAFSDPKLALSYNVKQKGPQAPVGRIRGVDFTTFVISSANYRKFLQKKDLEAYLAFFKNNY